MMRLQILTISVLLMTSASSAFAQNQAVQQPVVRQLRIGTSVSVPDGGRAYLGGVNSGASGTKRFGGPLRSGTNSGREFSNSSMSVSVYIHDFEAMDEALLNAGKPRPARSMEKAYNFRASHAWQSLPAGYCRR